MEQNRFKYHSEEKRPSNRTKYLCVEIDYWCKFVNTDWHTAYVVPTSYYSMKIKNGENNCEMRYIRMDGRWVKNTWKEENVKQFHFTFTFCEGGKNASKIQMKIRTKAAKRKMPSTICMSLKNEMGNWITKSVILGELICTKFTIQFEYYLGQIH